MGDGANGTRDRVSTFSLDHPVYTVPTGLSESQEDNVFLSLPCLDQSGGPCGLWDSVLSSLKRTHEPFLCPPGLSISSPGRDRSGGRTLEGHAWPTASPTRSIFKANASNITCFYNSRANVSCTWNHDEGLRATACCLHSRQPPRCVWG